MSDPSFRELMQRAYADAEDLERRIEDVQRRNLTDPIVHAVVQIMRQAVDHESGRERAVLAGTAAILPFLAAAKADGYAEAVARVRQMATTYGPLFTPKEIVDFLAEAVRTDD